MNLANAPLSGSHSHKAALLLFLHEANLIKNPDPIISLSPTSDGERSQRVARIIVAYWNGANLQGADLHDACLCQIDLRDAILSNASLSGANLEDTVLRGADLQLADLTEASLTRADLTGANLKGAIGITTEELEKQAKSLKGATMSDGSIHPRNYFAVDSTFAIFTPTTHFLQNTGGGTLFHDHQFIWQRKVAPF